MGSDHRMRPGTYPIEAHPGGIGVCEPAAPDVREELIERHGHNFAELVLVEALPAQLSAACCQDGISSVSGVARQPRLADQRQVGGYEPRLLAELPGSGLNDAFILLDHPARQLQQDQTRARAELPGQHNMIIIGDRNDRDSPGANQDVPVHAALIGRDEGLGLNRQEANRARALPH
jgi:hypothetical protein